MIEKYKVALIKLGLTAESMKLNTNTASTCNNSD